MVGDQMLGGGSAPAPWLRAFDDPQLRGCRVLDTFEVEVEPWPDAVPYKACPNGGRDGGVIRTKGEPASMRSMYTEHGLVLQAAADHFGLPVAWVAGMAGIEAVRGHGMRWDTRSYRYEPHVGEDGDFSAGIMQTLSSTAEGMRKKHFPDMPRFLVGGRLPGGGDAGDHALFDHEVSALLGAAYMQRQVERGYGMNPVLICAGYNAGRARKSDESEWGVKTYSPTRVTKMIAWINDYTAVLREQE